MGYHLGYSKPNNLPLYNQLCVMRGWRSTDRPSFMTNSTFSCRTVSFRHHLNAYIVKIMALVATWGRHLGYSIPYNLVVSHSMQCRYVCLQTDQVSSRTIHIRPSSVVLPLFESNFLKIMRLVATWGRPLRYNKRNNIRFHSSWDMQG